jgi:hypothetical protein
MNGPSPSIGAAGVEVCVCRYFEQHNQVAVWKYGSDAAEVQ